MLIIGSSIAQNIYKGLLENTEFEVNYVSIPGCPPLIDNYSKDILNFNEEKCEDFYRQVMKILKDNKYHKVLIAYDWSQLIFDKNLLNENLVIEMVDNFSCLLSSITCNCRTTNFLGKPVKSFGFKRVNIPINLSLNITIYI